MANKVENDESQPYLKEAMIALRKAAAHARQVAIDTNTAIIVVENGVIKRIGAEELKRQAEAAKRTRRSKKSNPQA